MAGPDFQMRYPLAWPEGRPRTSERKSALFKHEGRAMTLQAARRRLTDQVGMLTRTGQPWRTTSLVLSMNIRFTLSGARDQSVSRRDPDDPGVAFFFDLDGRPHVLACDRWSTVADNVAAIAAHIDALRGQERWGVADLRQAFAGHAALPPPNPWWEVLDVARGASLEEIHRAYRDQARFAHPNAGGERTAWDRLSAAYEAAKRERGH
jgi:hypothetical protein